MTDTINITELHKLFKRTKITIQKYICLAKVIPVEHKAVDRFNHIAAYYDRAVVVELLNKAFGMEVE